MTKAYFIKENKTDNYLKPVKHAFDNVYEFSSGKIGATLFLEHQIMPALKYCASMFPEIIIVKEELKA